MKLTGSSAFARTIGLIGLTALVVQAANIIALATTPTPSTTQFSLRQAAAILQEPKLAEPLSIPVFMQPQPPQGERDLALEELLAELLNQPPDRVRIVFSRGASIQVLVPDTDAADESGMEASTSLGELQFPEVAKLPPETRLTLENAALPTLIAAYQPPGEDWIIVGEQETFWSDWRFRLALTFLATLAVLTPLAWWAAQRSSRPLRELATRVQSDTSTALAAAQQGGSQEVQAVASAIDQLRTRLDAQLADRERIVAAMAHDLRTPLTGLRLRAEQAPDPARQRMIDDIQRMEAMIADVIDYSHSRQQRPAKSIELGKLVETCVNEAALVGNAVYKPSTGEVWVQGDSMKLRRAVSNLIRNAQKYGGRADVTIEADQPVIKIHVDDAGPGIPEADIERLMEPFQRGEGSRNRATGGAGLGLTIARDVAQYHGGALRLCNHTTGGLRATLELPQSSA
ncbi:MAG: HAMP domain-containing sensor histidine kinase [Pseudomonadota bacterium]